MGEIKFESKLIDKQKGEWKFNKEYFYDVPENKGVYIIGIKTSVSKEEKAKKEECFCPFYVGTYTNLRYRISGHWDIENTETIRGSLNSFKELFDVEVLEDNASLFYKDIKIWDEGWSGVHHSKRINLSKLCNKVKKNGNSLIWFPDPKFFDVYLNEVSNVNVNVKTNRHIATIENRTNLSSLKKDSANNLIEKIKKTREAIKNKYYYCYYSVLENDVKIEEIESAVKASLQDQYGIYTYAKANKPAKDKFKIVFPSDCDLINLKNSNNQT
jgi:hypothetical protein